MVSRASYDLVILGATGFTGQFVVEEVLRESTGRPGLRVAVAGRSLPRLRAGLETAARVTGVAVGHVALEVVDVLDKDKMQAIAAKTRLLISCVGPYRLYGLAVAEACVHAGADMLDISGEPEYLETVQAKLSEKAARAGVHIVGSCGFDSVPADMGAVYLQDNFPGELSCIEMVAGHGGSGGTGVAHATTLQCAVLGYANRAALKGIRRRIMPTPLQMPPVRPPKRGSLWWSDASQQWCVPNLGCDRSVVTRSQHLLHQSAGKKPIHFSAYFGLPSLTAALKASLFFLVFLVMSPTEWTRNLLIKWPEVFTFGAFSWAGPERDALRTQSFCVTLTGTGDDNGQQIVRHCRVRGPDPGYLGTALMLVQCALTALDEKDKMPDKGGVFTPSAAFHRTALVSRLQAKGVTFRVSGE